MMEDRSIFSQLESSSSSSYRESSHSKRPRRTNISTTSSAKANSKLTGRRSEDKAYPKTSKISSSASLAMMARRDQQLSKSKTTNGCKNHTPTR